MAPMSDDEAASANVSPIVETVVTFLLASTDSAAT